jgi:ribosomal protein S27E
MQTLSEYNAQWTERRKKERDLQRGCKYIGIACDQCKHELAGENILLLSSPPQQNIYCPGCGWSGRRFLYG